MVKNSDGWVEILSFAKVNLMLDVVGKRGDGYHEIVSLFQEVTLHDTLRMHLVAEEGVRLRSTRPLPKDNTVVRAYEVFKEAFGIKRGIEVFLIKRIPAGSGLGGGSSNGAAVLKFLGRAFGVSKEDLKILGARIGSDVPFFIEGGTAIVTGRGEIVETLPSLPPYGVSVFMASIRISTERAYRALRQGDFGKAPCTPRDLYDAYKVYDYQRIKDCSYNIFQKILADHYWELRQTMKVAENAGGLVSFLTGSGSAIITVHTPGSGTFRFVSDKPGKEHKPM